MKASKSRPAKPLVAEDDLPGADQVVVTFQQGGDYLALAEPGVGQAPDDRHALGSRDQVQAEPPEEPRMAGAVPVPGVPGQVRTPHRLPAGRARQRRGIHQPQQVLPGRGVPGQLGDHRRQQPSAGPQPLAVPGLAGQAREHLSQVLARVPDPAPLAGDAQQVLRDGQARKLRVVQRGLAAGTVITRPAQRGQHAVGQIHVECGQEGVKVVRHKTIFGALRLTFRRATRATTQSDSLI